ncbi:hypothetical protein B0I37DRAFT_376973 [Chaetomium sp. MPI-CAGE-AT-0009]|nr:hypothetical protein B0I37DRAFT_376973 [Chaetomium sp. MPI-CAGE-AT-0009]
MGSPKPWGSAIVVQGMCREWGRVSESVNRHFPRPMGPFFGPWKQTLECADSDLRCGGSSPFTEPGADRLCAGSILYHQNIQAEVARGACEVVSSRAPLVHQSTHRSQREPSNQKLGFWARADRSGLICGANSLPSTVICVPGFWGCAERACEIRNQMGRDFDKRKQLFADSPFAKKVSLRPRKPFVCCALASPIVSRVPRQRVAVFATSTCSMLRKAPLFSPEQNGSRVPTYLSCY